jgi:hypothetical protein
VATTLCRRIVDVRKNKLSGPIPTALSVIFFKNAAPGSVTYVPAGWKVGGGVGASWRV